MTDYLEQQRQAAIAYLGSRYVFHPDYKVQAHHSPQYKQSHTLTQFLLERGALASSRV